MAQDGNTGKFLGRGFPSGPRLALQSGWVFYGMPQVYEGTDYKNIATAGFGRFSWAQLEPEEGRYNWIPVDQLLNEWGVLGKPAGIATYPVSTAGDAAPEWVFAAGAQYWDWTDPDTGTTWKIPVWNDPVWKAKTQAFVQALGARYNSHPYLGWVDIRPFGNHGEGHVFPFAGPYLTEAEYLEQIGWYVEAFPNIRLVLPYNEGITPDPNARGDYYNLYQTMPGRGIGLRRDSFMAPSWVDYTPMTWCEGKSLAIGEWWRGYAGDKAAGEFSPDKLKQAILASKVMLLGMGGQGEYQQFAADNPGLAQECMGLFTSVR